MDSIDAFHLRESAPDDILLRIRMRNMCTEESEYNSERRRHRVDLSQYHYIRADTQLSISTIPNSIVNLHYLVEL